MDGGRAGRRSFSRLKLMLCWWNPGWPILQGDELALCQRDGSRVSCKRAAIHVGTDLMGGIRLERRNLASAEWLPPDGEELAQGVGVVCRRLHVDHAVGGVRVQPKEAGGCWVGV